MIQQTLFLLLVLAACTSTSPEQQEQTEMERYAQFEAELACELAQAGIQEDEDAVFQVLNAAEERAADYGYTLQEIQTLTDTYQEDENFIMLAQQKMRETCPDVVAELEIDQTS